MYDEDALSARGQGSACEVFLEERKAEAVRRAESLLEPLGGGETCGRDHEVALVRRGLAVLGEAVVEPVAAHVRGALRLELLPQAHGARVQEVERRRAPDADSAAHGARRVRERCEAPQEREVGGGDALVVEARAIRRDGDGRHACRALGESAERAVIRADDRGHGRADERDEGERAARAAEAVCGSGDLADELVVAAEDRVHVAERRAHDDAALSICASRLVEAADVPGAAAGVDDHDEPAEREEHGGRARVIGREGWQCEAKTFHERPPRACSMAERRRSSAS